MKYAVILCDGMADYKIKELGGKTPMEVASKPCMDFLVKDSYCGMVQHVPASMVPESDTANLSVMGYDPLVYSKGRSPLEAMSMGLEMSPEDTAFRTNVVTLSGEGKYEDLTIVDHSAGEISTEEADELIKAVNEAFANDDRHWYTGVSYRHCLIWKNCPGEYNFNRPHDILGKTIGEYLPCGRIGDIYRKLMEDSYEILKNHPVNLKRISEGKNPANSIWLWSPGKKPQLPDFYEKYGKKMAVISAVDLIKGIGVCAGAQVIDVEDATGNFRTNYKGKGEAAIDSFEKGADIVYVHIEAPDESGHGANLEEKIKSIELIDEHILTPVYEYLKNTGEEFKIMVSPDHPTPVSRRTHTHEPVPFFIYDSRKKIGSPAPFCEDNAQLSTVYYGEGNKLMDYFIND